MVHLVHLEEEDTGSDEDQESDDPSRIKGVAEEFMVCLARAVKDAQADEKHCYHCSSTDHFICNCPLIKNFEGKGTVKWQGGDGNEEGSLDPSMKANTSKSPQKEAFKV